MQVDFRCRWVWAVRKQSDIGRGDGGCALSVAEHDEYRVEQSEALPEGGCS